MNAKAPENLKNRKIGLFTWYFNMKKLLWQWSNTFISLIYLRNNINPEVIRRGRISWGTNIFLHSFPCSFIRRTFEWIVDSSLETSVSEPLSHCNDFTAFSSWLVYKRKLGDSGTYCAVISSINGAPAQTIASWRQSNHAPMAKDAKTPNSENIFAPEHIRALTVGCAISLRYT